jgi:hypothetical protein
LSTILWMCSKCYTIPKTYFPEIHLNVTRRYDSWSSKWSPSNS